MSYLTSPQERFRNALESHITENFTWSEALFHFRWGSYVFPKDETITLNIIQTAEKLESVRKIFGDRAIRIHSWLRAWQYNILIGGSAESAHIDGTGADFSIDGLESHEVRETLSSHAECLNIRIERLNKTDKWIHLDTKKPGPSGRYFRP